MRFYNTLHCFPSPARNPLIWGFWAVWRLLYAAAPVCGPQYFDRQQKPPSKFWRMSLRHRNRPGLLLSIRCYGNIREGPD